MTDLGLKLRFEPRFTYFWNRSSYLLYYNPVGLPAFVFLMDTILSRHIVWEVRGHIAGLLKAC